MEALARGLSLLLMFAGFALAQEPVEPEPPGFEGDPFEKIERENKLIDLQWRRDAKESLEWSIPGRKDAKWRPMFGETLDGVLGPGGMSSYVLPLLHRGDVLSLTDGEAHFRRLGIATDTAALLALARAPLLKSSPAVEALDRLVAVDLLRSRTDDASKRAVAQLASDTVAYGAVRARAAAATIARASLGAGDLLLPEQPDLVVVIDHSRLVDARPLVDLARLSGLVSSGMVLKLLKMPRLDDAAIGQAESDSCLELPFELVRRLGALRFDQSCVSLTWSGEIGGEVTWTAAVAGSFEPERLAGALSVHGCDVTPSGGGGHRFQWRDGHGELTDWLVTAGTAANLATRAALARHMLRDGAYSVRLHAPAGSKVLSLLAASGVQGATVYDLQVTLGDSIVVQETITAKSDEAAEKLAAAIPRLLERFADQSELAADFFEKLGAAKPTVDKNIVTTVREIQFAQLPLPTIAAARKWLLDQGRNRRPR